MFYLLTKASKKIIIDSLRDIFVNHPVYEKVKIVSTHGMAEREQFAIVVKVSSGSHFNLAADNYVARLNSFVEVARILGYPGNAIEWVREDNQNLRDPDAPNTVRAKSYTKQQEIELLESFVEQGKLAIPGNYWIELVEENKFTVDPLYVYDKEILVDFAEGGESYFYTKQKPIFDASEYVTRVYHNDNLAKRNTDYSLDITNGIVYWLIPGGLNKGDIVTIDYRVVGEPYGSGLTTDNIIIPYDIEENHMNYKAIPGVVLAFGRRLIKGDKNVVIVRPYRRDVALEYGGKWNLSFNLTVYGLDPMQTEEIADLATMYLWAIKRTDLENERGLLIKTIDIGGLNEFVRDETSNHVTHSIDITLDVETD